MGWMEVETICRHVLDKTKGRIDLEITARPCHLGMFDVQDVRRMRLAVTLARSKATNAGEEDIARYIVKLYNLGLRDEDKLACVTNMLVRAK